jgi:DHA1 family purine ribonucleoside efflux pump-like MFS transporter
VPFGAWLGAVWSWRIVFLLGAAVAAVALIAQAMTLPHLRPSAGASGLRALGSVLRSGIVLLGLLAILLTFGGHFSGFTYIRPAAQELSGIDAGGFALLLLVFGIANLLGTAVSGPLADRAARVGLLLFPGVLGVGMLAMFLAGASIGGLFIAAALWGFGFGGVPTTVLSWGARTEPARLEQIGGVIVTVCNVAIAIGASVGGVLVDGVTASTPLLVGGIAAIAGGVLLAGVRTRH